MVFQGVNRYADSPAPQLPVRRRRYGTSHTVYSTDRPSSAMSAYDNVMWPDPYSTTSPTQNQAVSPGGHHTNTDLGKSHRTRRCHLVVIRQTQTSVSHTEPGGVTWWLSHKHRPR